MDDPFAAMNVTDIRVIGVIGAGQMGSGIAQVAAQCGFRTLLSDATLDIASSAKAKIGGALDKLVAKGKLAEAARDEALERIEPTAGIAGLGPADLVIEAVR